MIDLYERVARRELTPEQAATIAMERRRPRGWRRVWAFVVAMLTP